jgi:hypothetical protein
MAGSLASGGIGINLINIPASLSGVANSKSWIVDRLLPSTTTTRDIEVSNTTSKPIKVMIYSGAATNIDGRFLTENDGITNLLTSWTTVTPSLATIPANSSQPIKVTITVPSGVADSEQAGVIWASTVTGSDGGVTQVSRVGIRMINPVGNYVSVRNGISNSPDTSTGIQVIPGNSAPFYKDNIESGLLAIALILIIIFLRFIKRKIFKLRTRSKKAQIEETNNHRDKIKLTAPQFLYLQDVFKGDPKKEDKKEDNSTKNLTNF